MTNKSKVEKHELIFLGVVILILLLFVLVQDHVQNENRLNEAIANYDRCQQNVKVETRTFDLIKDYNYTCKKIKFVIDNWVEETDEEFIDDGLFQGYHYETKYYGVGSIKLRKSIITKTPTAINCTGWSEETNIYIEKDWVNYYLNNCFEGDKL